MFVSFKRLKYDEYFFLSLIRALYLLQFPPEKFVETLKLMEHRYGAKDFVTAKDTSLLSPGTFYLTEVDSMYRRYYARKDADNVNTEDGIGFANHSLVNGHK